MSDGSAVSFRDAISEWGAVAHDVLLETASRYNDFVTYKELAEKVQEISGIRTKSQMRNWIGKVLAVVVEECARRDEPPLTSLCVTQNQTVGDGYRFVLETAGEPIPDDLDHHAAEARLKCYRAYSTDLPSNLNLSRGSRAGLSGFGLDTETVDPVCIHGRLPDTVG